VCRYDNCVVVGVYSQELLNPHCTRGIDSAPWRIVTAGSMNQESLTVLHGCSVDHAGSGRGLRHGTVAR
jgi:hypothetical protein